MKVEITEERLKDAGYSLVAGDAITVPDDVGQKWCDYGWAKDTSGAYESAERVPGVRPRPNSKHKGDMLEPQNAKMGGK